jgi:glycosyltransferase involved in cell wall biosynthesis
MKDLKISIVIPVLNEEDSIQELYLNLKQVLNQLKNPYEIVFVDDGSADSTFVILEEIASNHENVSIIKLRRNFGKSIALNTAFRYTGGDIVITMDGDLQDDPEEIPRFIEKIEEGYDLVVGWKYPRNDPITKKIASKFFNKLTCMLTDINLHDFNCGFKAYKKIVMDNISLYGEMHRYIPALAAWNGFKIAEIKVKHHPRKFGKSKYGFSRLFKGLLDLITVKFLTGYATRPMHVFGIPGTISVLVGFFIGLYLVILKYWKGVLLIERPLLLLAVLLILLGLQFLSMGLLGEMMAFQGVKGENVGRYIERIMGDINGRS